MPDWHRTKWMWDDWMLDPCCDFQLWPHPWHWPWIFNVKFWNGCIPRMGGPIDMERKGYESIGCYTYCVALTRDLDLGFSRSNFENAVSQEWEGRLTWNQRDVSRWDVRLTLWLWSLTSPMILTLDFQCQFLNSCISGAWGPIKMERKGYESKKIGFYTYYVTLSYDCDLGFWRLDFIKALS